MLGVKKDRLFLSFFHKNSSSIVYTFFMVIILTIIKDLDKMTHIFIITCMFKGFKDFMVEISGVKKMVWTFFLILGYILYRIQIQIQ